MPDIFSTFVIERPRNWYGRTSMRKYCEKNKNMYGYLRIRTNDIVVYFFYISLKLSNCIQGKDREGSTLGDKFYFNKKYVIYLTFNLI